MFGVEFHTTSFFSKFNESKFALNHFIVLMKTDFKLFPSTALFKLLMIKLVSSANKVVKGFALTFEHLMISGRSLIYRTRIKKNIKI
jgi:hypothetical protein